LQGFCVRESNPYTILTRFFGNNGSPCRKKRHTRNGAPLFVVPYAVEQLLLSAAYDVFFRHHGDLSFCKVLRADSRRFTRQNLDIPVFVWYSNETTKTGRSLTS
jgi:hypothetical protein